IRKIQKETGITTVCVTHDLEEAFAMSDRIGLLVKGVLHQVGDPEEIYYRPTDRETAELLGPVNAIPPSLQAKLTGRPPSGEGEIYYRPESLTLTPLSAQKGRKIGLYGEIQEKTFSGAFTRFYVRAEGILLQINGEDEGFSPGDGVRITPLERHSVRSSRLRDKEII
ncbi:MAG: hypothetical protein PQJ60_08760, partial [Spirochaetales bacterium]|nr:hypothetical protein [Spirochaetales bacterium]